MSYGALGKHVAVAFAYAATYEVLRYFSSSLWMLPASLRVACLLLVPRTYWIALVMGDFLPVAQLGLMNADRFGVPWATLVAIPPILFYMPATMFLQKQMRLTVNDGRLHAAMILGMMFLCSVMNSLINMLAFVTIVMHDGSPRPEGSLWLFCSWTLGYYLGALTFVPLVIALRSHMIRLDTAQRWEDSRRIRLIRDIVFVMLPISVIFILVAHASITPTMTWIRCLVIIPVALISRRHGWTGAALCATLGSIAVTTSHIAQRDPTTIPAELILAATVSVCLLLSRETGLIQRHRLVA
ncbi:MASE1 domain-containing protein [Luteibacter sp. PPL552]